MDMRGVAEQESATLAEVLRHPMMHVVGREPIHLIDLDLEVIDRPAADILEFQRIGMIGALVPHRSDQTSAAFAGQRKDGKEVGFVEVDVQFAVDRGAGRLDVGDIEELAIGPAGKAGAEGLAHQRARAVAAGDVGCLAVLFLPVGSAEAGGDATALVGKAHQLRSSLDRDAELLQPLDQQPLVLVLREDFEKGIGGQILADGLEGKPRRRFALHPQIDRGNLVAVLHHELGEVELPVEFEGTRLNRQSTRGRAGLRRLVDDAHLDAELGQPQRQDEAGRAGADDQNVAVHHVILRLQSTDLARLRSCRSWTRRHAARTVPTC